MLIKRTERQARRGTLAAALPGQTEAGLDRRSFLRRSGLVAGGLAALGTLAAHQRPQGASRTAGQPGAHGHHPQEHLHALLGRLHGDRRSVERRLDRPGARLGIADQSRLALRQGRGGARTRARRPPAEISDEAGQRPVDQDVLGEGDRRDRRQDARDPREVRAGFGLLARLGQVLQRRRLSQPQVRGLLGHQQRRPPGPHLPLDHRRRRRQYLGLRRDDQQLQRHPQRQDHDHHGRQSRPRRIRCRCSTCSRARSSTARTSS